MVLKRQLLKRLGLPMICGMILCCILVAGLWPFHQPENQVSWSQGSDGLSFGRYGIVTSSSTLKTARSQAEEACSIEMWLQPRPIHNNNTILTFYTPENPRQFSLSKWETGFVLRREVRNARHEVSVHEAFVADAFRDRKSVFISIAADGHKSMVYVDGIPVTPNRDFVFSAKDLTGQLVIGTSPVSSNGWYGQLLGLAVYRRNLTPAQVLRDYEVWTKDKHPEVAVNESSVAVYRFNEHRGEIVHNLVSRGPNLYIPQHFVLLDQPMLQSPWTEFRWTWGYWLDVIINIAGFVPLGFFFYAYLLERHGRVAVMTTVLIGAATSLTIELLQAYLPTRNSGLTDLFTNTTGTYFGVVLYRVVQNWLPRMRRIGVLHHSGSPLKERLGYEEERTASMPSASSVPHLDCD